jgi:hypothetical protein
MLLLNLYKVKDMYNFKCLSLFIISLVLVGCGGGTSTTAAPATAATLSMSFTPTKAFHFTWTDVSDATYYKLKEAITVGSGYTSVDDNIASTGTANSIDHVVPLYGRLNAKYILQSCNSIGCTDSPEVFTSTKVAQMVDSIGYFKASNTGPNDMFGYSVTLSKDGNTMAVGARAEGSNATGINGDQSDNSLGGLAGGSGAVYVFIRSGKSWTQQAYIKATNTGVQDAFGMSVSLSADGSTLAVGANGEASNATGINGDQTDNSASSSGAAYVFTRSGTGWSQQAYIKASNTEASDRFGRSVSLSPDGSTLAVGANGEASNATGINGDQTDNSVAGSGAAYVFTRSGTSWSQQAYIKASNTGASDSFGMIVSLSTDGNTMAVNSQGEGSNATGINGDQTDNSVAGSGAAYVFTRSGTSWSQQAYIKASNAEANDYFSYSMNLSADGNTLAVGTPYEDSNAIGINGDQTNNSAVTAGAAYVFSRTGTSWSQQAYIKASNAEASDWFGVMLSLSADGNTLAIGASDEASNATGINGDQTDNTVTGSGAVYLFNRSGSSWSQQAYLKASTNEIRDSAAWPTLSGDGNTLAVGAFNEDSNATGIGGDQSDNSTWDAGAVYIY